MRRNVGRIVGGAVAAVFLALPPAALAQAGKAPAPPEESKACAECHKAKTPAIVGQWADSKHATVEVGCYDCHQATAQDPDGFEHFGRWVATVVTPKDCARCHSDEAAQFQASHHAAGAKFVGSLDNILGEIVEGKFAAALGCQQCHGSTVAVVKDASGKVVRDEMGRPKFDSMTWPNSGIGRINMDGSNGSCTACHVRHNFSIAQVRQPEVCGKCHMGPDHPQIEIYNESKHGIAYNARKSEMNLGADTWVAGKDYTVAPTCATCHMSATRTLPVTHDIGDRLSWTLRPVLSKKMENWEKKRTAMKDVCSACHSSDYVNSFYEQYDGAVTMYNEKFARPAQKVMDALKAGGKLTPTPFDDKIEWTFYFLWHHEGRRARMGASMQGPDYTQWHGFFEVAHRFYFEFLPEAHELAHGSPEIEKVIAEVEAMTEHQWKKGLKKEDIEKIESFYKERYGGAAAK